MDFLKYASAKGASENFKEVIKPHLYFKYIFWGNQTKKIIYPWFFSLIHDEISWPWFSIKKEILWFFPDLKIDNGIPLFSLTLANLLSALHKQKKKLIDQDKGKQYFRKRTCEKSGAPYFKKCARRGNSAPWRAHCFSKSAPVVIFLRHLANGASQMHPCASDFRAFLRNLMWKITQKRALGRTLLCNTPYYKEVFVKHEQAPTAPKLEGVWAFCRFKIYFLWKPLFLADLTTSGRVFFDRNG